MITTLEVGPQGRVVIPAAIRKSLGIETGATLVATVVDGKLVLETPEQLLKQFYSRFAIARMRPDVAVADELIAERRNEAAHE